VIGIALLVAFSAISFRDAPLRLLAAHCLIALPYTTRTILASLARLDGTLGESARTLGAGEASVFWHITLPLLRPGILAGMIFAFLQSFGDVPISMFLTDARNNTLPLAIMAFLEYNTDPTVAAISSMVTVACLVLALLLERLFGLRRAVAG
jgi:putative spermidine/putrescine transport system permease protein